MVLEGSLPDLPVTGEGTLVTRPEPAVDLELQAVTSSVTTTLHLIQVGSLLYYQLNDQPWTRGGASSQDPLGSRAIGARLVGEETLPAGRSWHLTATRDGLPFELWVRRRDGYPLRTRSKDTATGLQVTANFDRFNTGATVTAPPVLDQMP